MKTWMSVLAGLASLAPLSAGPITVTINFTGSGTVGTAPFSNATVLITAKGDTSANTTGPPGVFYMHPTTTTISITSFALATVTDPNTTGVNQGASSAYFSSPNDELVVGDLAFNTYNLQTSLGPLTPSLGISTINWATIPVHTDQGNILVTSSSKPSYQAVVAALRFRSQGRLR